MGSVAETSQDVGLWILTEYWKQQHHITNVVWHNLPTHTRSWLHGTKALFSALNYSSAGSTKFMPLHTIQFLFNTEDCCWSFLHFTSQIMLHVLDLSIRSLMTTPYRCYWLLIPWRRSIEIMCHSQDGILTNPWPDTIGSWLSFSLVNLIYLCIYWQTSAVMLLKLTAFLTATVQNFTENFALKDNLFPDLIESTANVDSSPAHS